MKHMNHGQHVKSGGYAVVNVQPTVKTGMVGAAGRGSTTRVGKTDRNAVEKSGQSRLGSADAGYHASGGKHMPGASYQKEQRL